MKHTEIYKQLLKNKIMAKFSHYTSGNLYYTVQLEEGLFQLRVETVIDIDGKINLSRDLGTTSFYNELRASELNRWIIKSIESGDFVKII